MSLLERLKLPGAKGSGPTAAAAPSGASRLTARQGGQRSGSQQPAQLAQQQAQQPVQQAQQEAGGGSGAAGRLLREVEAVLSGAGVETLLLLDVAALWVR